MKRWIWLLLSGMAALMGVGVTFGADGAECGETFQPLLKEGMQ